MADPSPIRRTLRMHPAHRVIGVWGFGTVAGGYVQTGDFPTEDTEAQPPKRDGPKPEGETWDQALGREPLSRFSRLAPLAEPAGAS